MAGLRDADAEVARDLGQQAHDHEFTGADGEAADAKRQHGAQEAPVAGSGRKGGIAGEAGALLGLEAGKGHAGASR